MLVLALSGILILVIGGCVCVWWAARGGPRWVRAVSTATLAAGEAARLVSRVERNPDGRDDG
ncbi:hypothetical protein ACI2L1_05265 [Streptomyces sp. NPDC019531]|uniref:hypothetical protein n=1 Tax=Streptomyces sp. NPDC019531 TaxID=3365062 RepID=UPI00384E2ABB